LPEAARQRGGEPQRTAIGGARKQTKVARLARVSAHEFIRRDFDLRAASRRECARIPVRWKARRRRSRQSAMRTDLL